jgi:hypothetical protein
MAHRYFLAKLLFSPALSQRKKLFLLVLGEIGKKILQNPKKFFCSSNTPQNFIIRFWLAIPNLKSPKRSKNQTNKTETIIPKGIFLLLKLLAGLPKFP